MFVFVSLLFANTVQDGKTALHLAAEHGRVTVVLVLLGAHVNINLQDKVLYVWEIDLCSPDPLPFLSLFLLECLYLLFFPFLPPTLLCFLFSLNVHADMQYL